jgi:stage V sporulation protein D (sporulation-specific penicillin-binding protein)
MGEKRRNEPPELKVNRSILRRTHALLLVCGVVIFSALIYQLYKIQIAQHDKYETLAIEQQTRQATITASRGTIYDVNGKTLAVSASAENVFISPYETNLYKENKELIASNLAAILDVDRASVLTRMENIKSQYQTIKTKIDLATSERVREFISENGIKSIHLEPATKRYYPHSSLASQVIGFVGTDNYGLEGLEAEYNSYLTGTNGRIVRLKNGRGTDMLFNDFEDYYDAKNGNDITLTIDSTIQYFVEKHLAQAIIDNDVQKGGACIVMRPKTGEILAMASFGNYDLNNYLDVSDDVKEILEGTADTDERAEILQNARFAQWRNKALSDTYEPGSVFKIVTLAMALEEGIVNLDDTFYCGGSMTVQGRTTPLKCWKAAGHGTQSLSEAMQNSCNVALVTIGLRVGAERFYQYIDAFGFRGKTGFDLPGESGSLWWSDKVFKDSDNKSQLASASFGQTFNITPLQLITAVSASVNGGNLVTPHVVERITDPDGNIVLVNDTRVVRQVISEETSAIVRDILEDVVKEGTGHNAYVKGYRVGGKTGTSEKTAQDALGEGPKEYVVSFCGVAPTDDPEVVVLLLLDTPSNETGKYISGGVMAAPVVGNMLSDILPYLGIAPQYTPEEIEQLNVTVRALTTKTIADAKNLVLSDGLECRVIGDGDTVTDQLPAPNAVVSPKTTVILYAGGKKPENTPVSMPNLFGRSYLNAKSTLESAGLFIRSSGALSSLPGATVSVQSVTAGTDIAYGDVIEVTLVDSSITGNY